MIQAGAETVVGRGGANLSLDPTELRAILDQALAGVPRGARVLAIVPDRTRDDNTGVLFPLACGLLAGRVAALDALIAQGTHPPMTEAQKREKIGWGPAALPALGRVFDHQWDRADQLVTLGELSAPR